MKEDVDKFLEKNIDWASQVFHDELNTDENKDYRRGFRAGVLFSFLRIKSQIGNINHGNIDQSNYKFL